MKNGFIGVIKVWMRFLAIALLILFPSSFSENRHDFNVSFSSKTQVFFVPDDDVRTFLINLIESETEAIAIACFRLTDTACTKALMNAFKRGVALEIVADEGCLGTRIGKVRMLHKLGIPISIYPTVTMNGKPKTYSLMHHKFALFKSQKAIWTGSMNFTVAGMEKNQENITLLFDTALYQKYLQQFEKLKLRSTLL